MLAEPIGASKAEWEKRESWLGVWVITRIGREVLGGSRGSGGVRRLILRRLAEWE